MVQNQPQGPSVAHLNPTPLTPTHPRAPQLGKVHLDRLDWPRLMAIVAQLHDTCRTADGEDDQKKGTQVSRVLLACTPPLLGLTGAVQLLEIYALEIQMYTERKDLKKLKVGRTTELAWARPAQPRL